LLDGREAVSVVEEAALSEKNGTGTLLLLHPAAVRESCPFVFVKNVFCRFVSASSSCLESESVVSVNPFCMKSGSNVEWKHATVSG
jgi:hypothetical protein